MLAGNMQNNLWSGLSIGASRPRLNTNCTLDTTFADNGLSLSATTGGGYNGGSFKRMILDNTNHLVVAGNLYNGSITNFTVSRYDMDGNLDTSFATNGLYTINTGTNSTAMGVSALRDGRLAVVGYYEQGSPGENYIVAMINGQNALEERTYFSHDNVYNITASLDTGGNVIERYTFTGTGDRTVYDAAYATTLSGSQIAQTYGSQGGSISDHGNVVLHQQRYLSTTLGVWISNDPLGFVDGGNRFHCMGGNMIAKVDPSGNVTESDGKPPKMPDGCSGNNIEWDAIINVGSGGLLIDTSWGSFVAEGKDDKGCFFKESGSGWAFFNHQAQPNIGWVKDTLSDKRKASLWPVSQGNKITYTLVEVLGTGTLWLAESNASLGPFKASAWFNQGGVHISLLGVYFEVPMDKVHYEIYRP